MPDPLPRIGLGWDRHGVTAGRPCILGGIEIPNEVGPLGHSDADVLLHALTDAVLGAAGLEDLGSLFPDDDPQWKGAASTRFLEEAMRLLAERDLIVASADMVLICDTPKLRPHRAAIRENLARLLQVEVDRVNLKGKTTEGGCSGSITAKAVVLLVDAS